VKDKRREKKERGKKGGGRGGEGGWSFGSFLCVKVPISAAEGKRETGGRRIKKKGGGEKKGRGEGERSPNFARGSCERKIRKR